MLFTVLATVTAVVVILIISGDRYLRVPSRCSPRVTLPTQDGEKTVLSQNLSGIEKYLDSLFPRRDTIPLPDMPAFVTAFSSNHFEEGRAMLYNFNQTVRTRYPKLKLYFFDIGLSREEAMEIKTICQCTFKTFPFDEFPSHLQILKGYAWKPIAIQRYLDGGFTNNFYIFDEGRTITISPFSGDMDIAPSDLTKFNKGVTISNMKVNVNLQNVHRCMDGVWPSPGTAMLAYYERGFIDCVNFLKQENSYESTGRRLALDD